MVLLSLGMMMVIIMLMMVVCGKRITKKGSCYLKRKIINREYNIIAESPTYYVYRVKHGHYQVREISKSFTHSTVIFDLENEDEDEDTKQRAIDYFNGLKT
jgi:hypothetical protein